MKGFLIAVIAGTYLISPVVLAVAIWLSFKSLIIMLPIMVYAFAVGYTIIPLVEYLEYKINLKN